MVALAVNRLDLHAQQETQRISLDINAEILFEDRIELKDLLGLGVDQLEIVVRRRAARPQDIQSEAEPAPWRVTPGTSKTKKAVKTDAPETQPEPEEPTTAQLVEEFGSWG